MGYELCIRQKKINYLHLMTYLFFSLTRNVRVNISDILGTLILSVQDLHETDRGNYTCTLMSEHDPPLRTSVNVVVLPSK